MGRNNASESDDSYALKRGPIYDRPALVFNSARSSFHGKIDSALIEEARDVIYHTTGWTLQEFLDYSVERELRYWRKIFGGKVPKRKGPLPKGRYAYATDRSKEARKRRKL